MSPDKASNLLIKNRESVIYKKKRCADEYIQQVAILTACFIPNTANKTQLTHFNVSGIKMSGLSSVTISA